MLGFCRPHSGSCGSMHFTSTSMGGGDVYPVLLVDRCLAPRLVGRMEVNNVARGAEGVGMSRNLNSCWRRCCPPSFSNDCFLTHVFLLFCAECGRSSSTRRRRRWRPWTPTTCPASRRQRPTLTRPCPRSLPCAAATSPRQRARFALTTVLPEARSCRGKNPWTPWGCR